MAESGCLKDLSLQHLNVSGRSDLTKSTLSTKTNVITPGGARTLLVSESGSLVIVAGNDAIVLPTITSADIGTNFTFLYPVSSTTAATVTTGGTDANGSDDFVPGGVHTVCTLAQTSGAFISSTPIANGDNTLTFDDTGAVGAGHQSGSVVKCTAIAASGAVGDGNNVWFCEGQIITDQAAHTGVDTFTAV